MPRQPRSSQRQRHGKMSWLLLAWLMLGVVLALMLWQTHRQIEARERDVLEQQAQVLRQQMQVDIRMIYLGLGKLMERLPDWQQRTDGAQELQWQLQTLEAAVGGVRSVSVLDADGIVIASSRSQLVGLRSATRDDAVRRRSSSSDFLLVSTPIVGALGRPTVILSRALRDAHGAYGGAVAASIEEDELRASFEAVRYAPDMIASLIHGDGNRVLAVPVGTDESQMGTAGTAFAQHQESGKASSVQLGTMRPGGKQRLVALSTLSTLGPGDALPLDRPLVLAVGRDWQAMFAPWRRELVVVLGAYLLTLLVAGGGMLSAGRRSQLAERQRAQVQAEAERLHQMLERLPENVPGMIYQYRLDADGSSRFPYSTEGVREIYGLAPEAVREDASAVLARLHPRDLDRVLQGIQESARTLGVWEDEYRVLLPDRGLRWVHGIARPQRVEAGGVLWHGYIHDVTEQRQVRERLDRLLRNVPGALFQIQLHRDGSKRFPYVSAGVKSVYGLSPQELYEDAGRLQARIHPEDLPEWLASTVVSARDLSLWEQEFRVRLPERGERWIHAIAQPERIHDDAVQWYGYAYDVTEAKQQQLRLEATERQLRELAYVDGLTGVANRRHFDEQLQIEWRRCERSGQPLALDDRHRSFQALQRPVWPSAGRWLPAGRGGGTQNGAGARSRPRSALWWRRVRLSAPGGRCRRSTVRRGKPAHGGAGAAAAARQLAGGRRGDRQHWCGQRCSPGRRQARRFVGAGRCQPLSCQERRAQPRGTGWRMTFGRCSKGYA